MADAMSLQDAMELADKIHSSNKNGPRCRVSVLMESLTDDDRELVMKLVRSEHRHTTVAQVLQAAGHDISPLMISRHRGKGVTKCTCGAFDIYE